MQKEEGVNGATEVVLILKEPGARLLRRKLPCTWGGSNFACGAKLVQNQRGAFSLPDLGGGSPPPLGLVHPPPGRPVRPPRVPL